MQRSNRNKTGVDCAPFIDFMLETIENTMYKYVDVATTTILEQTENVGVNAGIKGDCGNKMDANHSKIQQNKG